MQIDRYIVLLYCLTRKYVTYVHFLLQLSTTHQNKRPISDTASAPVQQVNIFKILI